MAHEMHRLTSLVIILAVTSSAKDQSRWSRQISSYTSDISDWVPLSGPVEREPTIPQIKRQAVAEPRILTEPFPGIPRSSGFTSDFPRNYYNGALNRQLYLQSVPSVPSAPQNYLTDQGFGQSIRFGLSQPNFPLNQAFVSPQFGYEGLPSLQSMPQIPQIKPFVKSQPNPIKFDYTKTPQQVAAVPAKPFINQPQKVKVEAPKFIDGYRVENTSYDFSKKKPQSLQKIKFDYEKPVSRPEIPPSPKPQSKVEREEVQLLYVPLESLNKGQFNFRNPLTPSQVANTDIFGQGGISQKKMTELHRPIVKSIDNGPQIYNYFSEFNSQFNPLNQQKEVDQVPKFSTLSSPFPTSPLTTPKPKKLKPHQPPLAIFLTEDASKNNQIKVGDVLNSLKTANSVAVLDSVNPLNAPKVFIGPSSLTPPEHYVKFELPYLSNIDNSDKKLRQLPFFVAPLSYNAPQGFAKIPFPSPHVGSVVINAQIKETNPLLPAEVKPNYYTGTYTQEQKPITQKPSFSYYTTAAPKTTLKENVQSNYYQFEPQTVSTLRPVKEPEAIPGRAGNYFITNSGAQFNPHYETSHYNPTHYQVPQQIQQNNYQQQNPAKIYSAPRVETTTAPRTTVTTTTTKPPSTYPSQLLETHNPYSINQAFHFSTPLDYRTFSDDFKEPKPIATPIATESPQKPSSTSPTPIVEEVTEKRVYQQSSPIYQSYTPEVHYESEIQNQRYPTYNNEYTKTESAEVYNPVQQSGNTNYVPTNPSYIEYTNTNTVNQDTQTQVQNETPIDESYAKPAPTENEAPKYEYNQSVESKEETTSTTTTTTTTSTKRPLRSRGRPRYTTTPRSDSSEYANRITRKPLRRPLPSRPRYEPNKITSDKVTKAPTDYSEETTTKSGRTSNRGRVTYKPAYDDYDRRRTHNSKEQELAYQRDVLHQNYPVTLMERASTHDIEAMTEPTSKSEDQVSETLDTENAYTYERATISQQNPSVDDDIPVFPSRTTVSQETSYVPKLSTHDDYVYHSRSSLAPAAPTFYEETASEKEDEFVKQTTPIQRETLPAEIATEPISINDQQETVTEQEYKEDTTTPEAVTEASQEEENVVQTTPSYNRVRVRPGVVKQYHQASTESAIKTPKRKPVTYRPAFDKRRTTMRIDEIEQDLKTKQVKGRQEDEYRHPVYKPESTTEGSSTQDLTTKRGAYRRRRPSYSYTTTSTEGSQRKYEVKNRFRGRRPTTEKPAEKTETTETTTTRPIYSRYQRPKLSERFKKPEPEDQESNYSINRPSFVSPDDKWSPKIDDSFKPYNPNTIADEEKSSTTERRSDRLEMDIITARNEYDDILISVTPATNNKNKKIPDIPPTLEALVEQSKVTKSDSNEKMSTFESMLEEVMKSLEEQDEDEYSSNVMKHKGGEIGEIPPERIISSGESTKPTVEDETTTAEPKADDSFNKEDEIQHKSRRRGYWKKVKVRPLVQETIETAESQYYPNTINRLGQTLEEKLNDKKLSATTYKPTFTLKDIFTDITDVTAMEINKISTEKFDETTAAEIVTEKSDPGDLDLGTGSPDPTVDDLTTEAVKTTKFSFMDYLFGTSEDLNAKFDTTEYDEITTEIPKAKVTTENTFIPDEITEDEGAILADIKRINSTEAPEILSTTEAAEEILKEEAVKVDDIKTPEVMQTTESVEETTPSSFMDPANVVSTSMSTEISHETEICFRGKCIKTFRDISNI